jgi:hypothetical protein
MTSYTQNGCIEYGYNSILIVPRENTGSMIHAVA